MFVCICNSYKDADIRAAARAGMRCPREIYETLGGAPRCGRCLEHAEAVIAEEQASPPEPVNALIAATA